MTMKILLCFIVGFAVLLAVGYLVLVYLSWTMNH